MSSIMCCSFRARGAAWLKNLATGRRQRRMTERSNRAVAVLKAKAGQEQVLVAFTLGTLASIRNVDGLRKVEVSRSLSDPGQLVLYYAGGKVPVTRSATWQDLRSPALRQHLHVLVDEHSLVLGEIVCNDFTTGFDVAL
jgi:hypothetical protein